MASDFCGCDARLRIVGPVRWTGWNPTQPKQIADRRFAIYPPHVAAVALPFSTLLFAFRFPVRGEGAGLPVRKIHFHLPHDGSRLSPGRASARCWVEPIIHRRGTIERGAMQEEMPRSITENDNLTPRNGLPTAEANALFLERVPNARDIRAAQNLQTIVRRKVHIHLDSTDEIGKVGPRESGL